MQLSVRDFVRPEKLEIEHVTLDDSTPAVLNDDARVREGDILSPVVPQQQVRVPTALRGINLAKITGRNELICALTHNLPRNEFNMPRLLYRPDILDPSVFRLSESVQAQGGVAVDEHAISKFQAMQDLLDASTIMLQYHEGYPALPNNQPFWAKFDWESPVEYDAFTAYMKLPGGRSSALLSPAYQDLFAQLFHTNYWGIRCIANDTFAVVHYQRMREQRILSTDDKHFLQAETMLNKLNDLVASVDWDQLKSDPKQFVEVYERLAKVQRTALGHAPQGGSGGEMRGVQSVEVIMRKTTDQTLPAPEQHKVDGLDIQQLLQDPDGLKSAQELILRVNSK